MSLMAVAFVVLLGACSSKTDSKDLLKTYASSKDKVVATINMQSLIEQSGCKINDNGKLELSSEIESILNIFGSSARTYIDYVIENEYIVYENAIVVFDYDENTEPHLVFAFNVKDSQEFMTQAGKDLGEKAQEKEDWLLLDLNSDLYLLSKENVAIILGTPNGETPIRYIDKLISRAESNPVSEDVVKRLNDGDKLLTAFAHVRLSDYNVPTVLSRLFSNDKVGAYYTLDVDGQSWKTNLEIATYDGKPTKGMFNGVADSDLLKYSGKDHKAVALVGDVKEYLDFASSFMSSYEKAEFNQFASLIDGPAMLSASFDVDTETLKTLKEQKMLEKVSVAGAITCANGRAGDLIDFIYNEAGLRHNDDINYIPGESITATIKQPIYDWSNYNYYTDSLPIADYAYYTVDIHTDGDVVVGYFNSTPGSNNLSSLVDSDSDSNIAIYIDDTYNDTYNELFGLNFGLSGFVKLKGNSISATTTVTRTDDSLVQSYLSLISSCINNRDEIKAKFR